MKHFNFTAERTYPATIYIYDNIIMMHLYAVESLDSVTRCFDKLYINHFDLNVFYCLSLSELFRTE